MVLTVLENAYFRRAEAHPNFSESHKRVLSLLIHERKYFTKDELFLLVNYSEKKVNKTIKDLEEQGLIETEGWLVRLANYELIF